MSHDSNLATIPPKRRWYQFSLRTLLIVVTLLCIWLGVAASRANRQKMAVEALRQAGAKVEYDYEFDDRDAPPPGPAWLRNLIGVDYFATVKFVDLTFAKGREEDVAMIEELPQVRFVSLSGSGDIDSAVAHLKDLAQLQSLYFYDCSPTSDAGWKSLERFAHLEKLTASGPYVTDLASSHIKGLKELKTLQVIDTKVTDAGLKHLDGLERLEFIILQSPDVTDAGISHFKNLPRLTYLDLRVSAVTESGLEELKRSLPHATIYCPSGCRVKP